MKDKLASLFAFGIALPAAALAQVYIGNPTAVDGDTIRIGDERIRLLGIDAPERAQMCERDGETWACGAAATSQLAALLEGGPIRCEQSGRDQYGRVLARCQVGSSDLSGEMAGGGLAVVTDESDTALLARQERARELRVGMWAGTFQLPSDYRAANPSAQPSAAPQRAERPVQTRTRSSEVYYRNCREARAAGAAPIYRGQPGYRPEMDGDGDGIACEPYRGR